MYVPSVNVTVHVRRADRVDAGRLLDARPEQVEVVDVGLVVDVDRVRARIEVRHLRAVLGEADRVAGPDGRRERAVGGGGTGDGNRRNKPRDS